MAFAWSGLKVTFNYLITGRDREAACYQDRYLQTSLKLFNVQAYMNANIGKIKNYTELCSYMSERSKAKSAMLILLFGESN